MFILLTSLLVRATLKLLHCQKRNFPGYDLSVRLPSSLSIYQSCSPTPWLSKSDSSFLKVRRMVHPTLDPDPDHKAEHPR